MSFVLPSECVLRPASASDIWQIRKLVFSAKLDPTQLRWQQFLVIECDKKIVACGQLRSFSEVQELSSLVVLPAWRNQGLGSHLVKYLIQQSSQPLYLECASWLEQFYTRFGFVSVSWREVPSPLKEKFRLTQFATKLVPIISLKVMQYRGVETPTDEKQTPLS
ncbi:GNAT family N-acetyltransferase [[Phormidium ambiguum] IAM M-71]|uniref:GNAT family N-acetyltransferase n=1 Tax=[Phormidium ambiguum] IAM M-71 TaxID=454136 RepID=A0A1U7INY0_9CYAN|nr:GNAT family N-acetyltransferase [Phormidium ambiguum]OKH39064.1 GNAT family N-acetyltransferase [Phormidium ambiguum IAM M-71]